MTGGTWYVEVVRVADGTVTATLGPGTQHRMKIADSGMQINLNHDAYYTRMVQGNATHEPQAALRLTGEP